MRTIRCSIHHTVQQLVRHVVEDADGLVLQHDEDLLDLVLHEHAHGGRGELVDGVHHLQREGVPQHQLTI